MSREQALEKSVEALCEAIDRLFAMLISAPGSKFFPSKSGQPWEALLQAKAALALPPPAQVEGEPERWDESYLKQIDTFEGGAADHIRACYARIDALKAELGEGRKELKEAIKCADYMAECYEQHEGRVTNSINTYRSWKGNRHGK